MYVYIQIYMYVYICVYTYIYNYIYIWLYMYVHANSHTWLAYLVWDVFNHSWHAETKIELLERKSMRAGQVCPFLMTSSSKNLPQ